MSVATEAATVYRGGGRRWFSLRAACNAEASLLFRKRFGALCECSRGDFATGYPGETCTYHEVSFEHRFRRRIARLVMTKAKAKAAGC